MLMSHIEELCRWLCHRRDMQMVISQKGYADGDATEEICRWSCHRRDMQMVMSQ